MRKDLEVPEAIVASVVEVIVCMYSSGIITYSLSLVTGRGLPFSGCFSYNCHRIGIEGRTMCMLSFAMEGEVGRVSDCIAPFSTSLQRL